MKFTLQPANEIMSSMSPMSSMSGSNSAGTTATSVSIVKGASNPNVQKPYSTSPVNVAVGRGVLWILLFSL